MTQAQKDAKILSSSELKSKVLKLFEIIKNYKMWKHYE
jgi:hypothetical protein